MNYLDMFVRSLANTYDVRVDSLEVSLSPLENAYEVRGWLSRCLPSGNVLSRPLCCRVMVLDVLGRHDEGLRALVEAVSDGGLRQLAHGDACALMPVDVT